MADVSITTKAEIIKVWIDGTRVNLTNGKGISRARPGHHALSWAVRGTPGSSYLVQITAPDESKLKHTDTFDSQGFDAGLSWFTVNA
jgi:hypothetical protein